MDGLEQFTVADREECGVILGTFEGGVRRATRVVKVKNHAKKRDDYAIKAADFMRVLNDQENRGLVFIGFFHTHLPKHDPRPSDTDYEGAKIIRGINCVYHPSTGTLTWYTDAGIVEERN